MASDESSRWDETRCKDGLAHLENLQNQIDDVRLSIPRILQTLLGNHPTPQDLFWDFRDTVTDVRKGLSRFESSWNDGRTQEVLEHARQSRGAKIDLRSGYGMVSGFGWTGDSFAWVGDDDDGGDGRDGKDGKDGGDDGDDDGNDNDAVGKVDDGVTKEIGEKGSVKSLAQINDAVTRLKELHPDFKIDVDEENRCIKVKYKANSLVLNFSIQYEQDDDGRYTFVPQCLGDMKLYPAITRCMASRPRPYDLNYLLDMIAAYENVRLTPCAKCKKYINITGITPAARRPNNIATSENAQPYEWEALHEECL